MSARALVLAALAIGCGSSVPRERADGSWNDVTPAHVCGDGIVDPKEQCDDGNAQHGDGCSRICQIECAFGSVSGTCVTPVCGDGIAGPREACDDGNVTAGDGCSSDCLAIGRGWRCPIVGRRCVPICGDGMVVGPEECDDGNASAGDGCTDVCLVEPAGDPAVTASSTAQRNAMMGRARRMPATASAAPTVGWARSAATGS